MCVVFAVYAILACDWYAQDVREVPRQQCVFPALRHPQNPHHHPAHGCWREYMSLSQPGDRHPTSGDTYMYLANQTLVKFFVCFLFWWKTVICFILYYDNNRDNKLQTLTNINTVNSNKNSTRNKSIHVFMYELKNFNGLLIPIGYFIVMSQIGLWVLVKDAYKIYPYALG